MCDTASLRIMLLRALVLSKQPLSTSTQLLDITLHLHCQTSISRLGFPMQKWVQWNLFKVFSPHGITVGNRFSHTPCIFNNDFSLRCSCIFICGLQVSLLLCNFGNILKMAAVTPPTHSYHLTFDHRMKRIRDGDMTVMFGVRILGGLPISCQKLVT